jgi:hypothetical protein
MHPRLMETLSRQHAAELRGPAYRSGRSGAVTRAAPRRAMRQQMGWALVEIGLRLAATSSGPAIRAGQAPGTRYGQ